MTTLFSRAGVSLLFILLAAATPAFAAEQANTACTYVPGGCGGYTSMDITIAAGVDQIASYLVALAAGGAVLFVIVGGAQMLLSFGDEGKTTKGKMSVAYALAGFGITLIAQIIVAFFVGAAVDTSFIADPLFDAEHPLLSLMQFAVNIMLLLFNITFVIVAIVAGFQLVLGHGKSDAFGKARNMLLWAIGGAIVVNVAHALVAGFLNIFS